MGLLNQGGYLPQEQPGPVQPGGNAPGVRGGRPIDEAFLAQAGAIHPDLLGQLGSNVGAMDRTRYANENLSDADAVNQQRLMYEHQNPSGIDMLKLQQDQPLIDARVGQAGAGAYSSMQSGNLSGLRMQELQGNMQREEVLRSSPLLAQLPASEQVTANQSLMLADNATAGAQAAVDWVEQRGTGASIPGVGTGDRKAMEFEWTTSVLPAVKEILGSGTLDNTEREFMMNLIGDPTKAFSMNESERKLLKTVAARVSRQREDAYRSYGVQPPPLPQASSAGARSTGATPQGLLTPYTGESNVSTGQVIRTR